MAAHKFPFKITERLSKGCLEIVPNLIQRASNLLTLLSKCQNHEEDCAHFCYLLRKAELYVPLHWLISNKLYTMPDLY